MMGGTQGVPYGYGMMGDDLEELLGIDHADIHAAHVSGSSLVELAAEKGVSREELIETIVAGRQAALQEAVEVGVVAQEWADQMLEFIETNIESMVEAEGMTFLPGMGGMMGGYGYMHGWGMMGGAELAPWRGAPYGYGMMGGYEGVGPCYGSQSPAE